MKGVYAYATEDIRARMRCWGIDTAGEIMSLVILLLLAIKEH